MVDPTTIAVPSAPATFGEQLRGWRTQRRYSQLDLAGEAQVSTRHLSYLENGRSKPSREMVVHLAVVLDLPLPARNRLLEAAGFAPVHPETDLDAEAMGMVREAVSAVLAGHQPNPAVVVDRHWDLVDANAAAALFLADVAPALLEPPVNVIRLSLHPDGFARTVVNFDEYAAHLVWRLRRQVERSADPVLVDLLAEAVELAPRLDIHPSGHASPSVVLPLRLRRGEEILSFFSTIAVFGAPLDVTLDDLAIEAFYPADAVTAEVVAGLAG